MKKIPVISSDNFENEFFTETETIEYVPNLIDEYLVMVKDKNDWEEVHNYIINENEIDNIPNRKIECANLKEFSSKSSVYLMSFEESEILKKHPKVEGVLLNPDKFPQPQSLMDLRYRKKVAYGKPKVPANLDSVTPSYTNNVRSNWTHLFLNEPTSYPFSGVGINTTTKIDSDINYSLTGKNVDAVIIDSGVTPLHPEFLNPDGSSRVKDVILDGPYKVDPDFFDSRNLTYTKVVDGVNLGVGIATTAAHNWWIYPINRSEKFVNIGNVDFIPSTYTLNHVSTKTVNDNNNQLIDGHGTACASQIGGKSFGLAFKANIWGIRISLSGVGGLIAANTALDVCTIWHNAKKISQNQDPDPTIINNSYGLTAYTGNTLNTTYTYFYRGSETSYIGDGTNYGVPSNSNFCRVKSSFTNKFASDSFTYQYSSAGGYNPSYSISSISTSNVAEDAINAGCIIVSAAGNNNQKLSDYTDIDYNNAYQYSFYYTNRVGGIQRGFSGLDERTKGSIRVGCLDNAVEPADSKQGSSAYSIRKVSYSNNGPMITIWAPGEMTLAAGYYGQYEDYQRTDNPNFYDTWFNGTSSACPNTVSLICLYLETNRSANQSDVIKWIDEYASVEINLSDPYPDQNSSSYWSSPYDSQYDTSSILNNSYNVRGSGNLRGATKKVLKNPYSNFKYIVNQEPIIEDKKTSLNGLNISGIQFRLQ